MTEAFGERRKWIHSLTMNCLPDNPRRSEKSKFRRGGPHWSLGGNWSWAPCHALMTIVGVFDYRAPAELYASASKTGKRPMRYTRFKSAAEAIKYAVEELPPELLIGSTLEVNEERFDGFGIRALYDSASYPLRRRKQS
jgi:hypothetical protein